MQEEHWEVVVELEALWSSTSRVQDLVLRRFDEMSSLVALLTSAVDLIEGCIDFVSTNRICWVAQLALTNTLLHFP
jgi:hypothetical protein